MPNGVWGGQPYYKWSPQQHQTIEAYYKFQMERIAADRGCKSLSGWGKKRSGWSSPGSLDDFFTLSPHAQTGNCKASELTAHDEIPEGDESGHAAVYFSEGTRSSILCLVTKANLDYFQEAANIFYEEYEQINTMKGCVVCLNISPVAARTI
ncbi:unnamed protein product [Clonostachys chloroleuca]|uniref:Uncharacterized protein n=1 Tax=Clonostachys chloroleuca TaxID=1926264 RepID=A0AA35LZB5_9HYPO|nr:unnamed protein product [Clonostachys chloroleuca]